MSDALDLTRRNFLKTVAVAGWALHSSGFVQAAVPANPLICFSKHLQFLSEYDQLAETLVELGYDGTDLTVRKGGHVLPENVERDLPKAVEAIRKAGVEVNMMTTDITGPDDPHVEHILKTASSLKIPYYRIGTWRYEKGKGILDQLNEYKPKMKALGEMNAHYNLRAGYHNHSGEGYIGGSLWELHEMFREADPQWIGYNYDAAHAVAEGAGGSWITSFDVVKPQIFGVAVKDCLYVKRSDGHWRIEYPPVGEGMTDWPMILRLLKSIPFTGPFSMHFEYDISGEGEEKRQNELKAIRHDVGVFKTMLKEAGFRS